MPTSCTEACPGKDSGRFGALPQIKRGSAAHRVRVVFGNDSGDPRGPVRGNMRDFRGSFRPERIEERAQGGLVLPRSVGQ